MKQWGGSFLEILNTLQNTNPTFKCFGLFNYELSFFSKEIETIKWWMMDVPWFWTILIKAISIPFHLSIVNRNIVSDKNYSHYSPLQKGKLRLKDHVLCLFKATNDLLPRTAVPDYFAPDSVCWTPCFLMDDVPIHGTWARILSKTKKKGKKGFVLDFISGCSQ